MARWIGVDVGGRRKGFDVAVVDASRLVSLHARLHVADVVALAVEVAPLVVAIDSPRSAAPAGATCRDGERALARAVCGIRWTPDAARLPGNPYYEWIVEGLELYRALAEAGMETIEVFPTASWTRWHGARAGRPRSAWSSDALAAQRLRDIPARLNQDQRDAIGAALTARAWTAGECELFGEIVVPKVPGVGVEPTLRGA